MGQTIQQRQLKVIESCRIATANTQREIVSHFSEIPCATGELTSYRARGNYGYIMIGAKSDAEAMREAFRSSPAARDLEVWNGAEYMLVVGA